MSNYRLSTSSGFAEESTDLIALLREATVRLTANEEDIVTVTLRALPDPDPPPTESQVAFNNKVSALESLLNDIQDLETELFLDDSWNKRDWSDVGTLNVAVEQASNLLGSLQALRR